MGKYSDYLSSALRERVDKLESRALVKLSLFDELAIVSEIFGQACRRYALVLEKTIDMPVADQIRIQSIAEQMVIDASIQVRDMALAQHRISEPGRQVDVSIVYALIEQMVHILDEELPESEAVVSRFAERARIELLTVDAVARSHITPDNINDEVKDMIMTVPDPPQLRVAQG